MKISDGFALREIGGYFIAVPFGKKSVSFKAMITLNESGAFLWNQLEKGKTENELLNAVIEEYDVDSDTANIDISRFISKLKIAGVLEG